MSDSEADLVVSRCGERVSADGLRPDQVDDLLSAGYTIGVRHVDRSDAEFAALARAFEEMFLAPADVHLYCTPAGAPGFGWHYDAEEVFVLQTCGSKEWTLRKNTVNPWPLLETLPADMRYEREIMPMMKCLLREGDWLYVPGGYWHSTQARVQSISLSVGLLPATAIDLLSTFWISCGRACSTRCDGDSACRPPSASPRSGTAIGLRYPVEVGLAGNCHEVLQAMLPRLSRPADGGFLEAAQHAMQKWRDLLHEQGTRDDKPLKPQVVAQAINIFLQDDAIITTDCGTVTALAARYIDIRDRMQFSSSGILATMVNGLPYSIGAAAAYPGRQVVCLAGDGGLTVLTGNWRRWRSTSSR